MHWNFLKVFVLVFLALACKDHPPADLIVYNARIYTVDSSFSIVEAMAIKDGRIVETGTLDHIRRTYRAPQNIDLKGKFVYPGFNDAHSHFIGYATTLRWVNLVGANSFEEVLQRTRDFQDKFGMKFIRGRGWDQNSWKASEFPTKSELDKMFPNTPVYLIRIDGHAALVNQAALDFAGVDHNTEIAGGIIMKDDKGMPNGILIDNALSLIKLPELPADELEEVLKEAEKNIFGVGLTTVTAAGQDSRNIHFVDSLQKVGVLKSRLYAMVSDKDSLLDEFLKRGPIRTDRLNVSSFKFYLDGSLGSRGALLLSPYSDDSLNYGLQLSPYQHYVEAARRLKESDWQMCVHAIGDSANRLVLNVFEEVLEPGNNRRWRVEHAQIVSEGDIQRFADLNVIPSVQPTHATSDMYWAEQRLGKDRMRRAYPYQDLLTATGVLPLGTDFPVEDISPLKTFFAAVFRQDENLYPEGGFLPNQRLSREDALRGMTIWPAFASFEEGEKGSLEAGKWADFVVLDTDIMKVDSTKLLKAKVMRTFVGGEQVFPLKDTKKN